MSGKLLAIAGLDRPVLAHGLRLALAAILAFSIAALFHVDNAFWAAMPVFVVSQPQRGLLLERAVLRVLGSVAGVAAGLGIIQVSGNPTGMLALLGVWVALSAFLVHMLRGVHSYGPLMAGISASVVVLPALFHPEDAFALALARGECQLIGVLCVTAVTAFFTAPSQREAFYSEVRGIAAEVLRVAGMMLDGRETARAEQALFRAMAGVQQRAALVTAASPEGYRRLHHIEALLVQALGVLGAARLAVQMEPEKARALAAQLGALADGLGERTDPAESLARLEAGLPDLAADVRKLLRADAVFDADPRAADARPFACRAEAFAPHRDERRALLAACLAGAATFAAGWAGYLLGWSEVVLTALGICTFSMILGSMPRPRLMAPVMLRGVLAGVAMALVYRFLLQPHVETVPQLILSVIPFALVGSLVRASPRHAGWGLDLNMCFWLGSQARLPAVTDTAVILGEGAALAAAILIVAGGIWLLPEPMGQRARNAAAAIRRAIARIAGGGGTADLERTRARTARHFLRLALEVEHVLDLAETRGGSFCAVLGLGRTLARMRGLLAEGPLAAVERAALEAALKAVETLCLSPEQLADALAALTRGLPEGETKRLLRAAGRSLADGRALIGIGLRHAA
ncbi:FUSC family protein [Pedomonas sp. V897]|uniref:FUSC family protein n=1 Tax=Pedomonas sp. V897 TaxID=3446482 RepID=UPI003EE26CDC